jgi:hypothetical protein
MHAKEIIEIYVDETVRLLPRRQRTDVAAELRALLADELNARAAASGRPADEALALSLVRAYGRPNEVAARYQPAWTLVEPADTPSFLRAASIGTVALSLLGALQGRLPRTPGDADESVGVLIFAWIGLLLMAFAVKSAIRRRWPATATWKPRDRNRVNRIGAAIVVPVASLILILYAAPAAVIRRLSGGRIEASSVVYTTEFQHQGLPVFIGLLIALLALLAFAALRGRWSRLTRRISIGLNLALACVVLELAVNGNIFQSTGSDQILRSVLALVAVIYIPCVGAQIYGEMGRLAPVRAATKPT